MDEKRLTNPSSYWIVDDADENGVSPCVGETLSITANHVGAVTLDPGLRPRSGDDTQSGTEFDPERPLQDTMVGAERFSMFGKRATSESTHNVGFSFTYCSDISLTPCFVDDSAQLDMVLSTGHTLSNTLNVSLKTPFPSASSSTSDRPPPVVAPTQICDMFSTSDTSLESFQYHGLDVRLHGGFRSLFNLVMK